jgi:hypothetical protein
LFLAGLWYWSRPSKLGNSKAYEDVAYDISKFLYMSHPSMDILEVASNSITHDGEIALFNQLMGDIMYMQDRYVGSAEKLLEAQQQVIQIWIGLVLLNACKV